MDFSLKNGLSTGQTAVVIGGAILLVFGIIVAAQLRILTMNGAGLVMNGVLTIATLGYVFLTYGMVSQMRRDIEVRERHENRPYVIERLELALLPLRKDIRRIRRVLKSGNPQWHGPDQTQIGERFYRSFHEVNPGYGKHTIPRFTAHLDIDNGVNYDVYQAVGEYSDVYQEAVYEMQRLILAELDGFEGGSERVRDFAVLALKVDDGENRQTPSLWDEWKEEVVPLRDEIPELMGEIEDLAGEVDTACGEALREIDPVLNETMKEYGISEGELDPEQPPEPSESYAPEVR